jgi:hypothetical protein
MAMRSLSMRHLVVASGLLGLCAIPVGIVVRGGSLTVAKRERAELRGAPAAAHGEIERREANTPVGRRTDDRWRAHLTTVENELARGHVDVAVRAWHDAYNAAVASRSWESMIAVGDAFMAIGRASGVTRGARMNAREAYLTALIRARRDRSLDGVLRTAQAFRELDDHAVAERCLRIAAQLAAGDEQAQQRLREWEPWAGTPPMTEF